LARLGVNRAEGSIEIRRERISRLDRLRDGAQEGTETTERTGCVRKPPVAKSHSCIFRVLFNDDVSAAEVT